MPGKTSQGFVSGRGAVLFQITAALQAASPALAAGDIGKWVNADNVLRSQSRDSRQRQSTDEYVTGDANPIVVVADSITPQTHTLVFVATEGAENYGLVGNINIVKDVLQVAFDNNLILPMAYTNKAYATGALLHTHTATNMPTVLSVGDPEITAGSNSLALRTVTIKTTGAPTITTVT